MFHGDEELAGSGVKFQASAEGTSLFSTACSLSASGFPEAKALSVAASSASKDSKTEKSTKICDEKLLNC